MYMLMSRHSSMINCYDVDSPVQFADSTSTTTSARLPAERRGTPHHRRPPWLGFWWSGVIDVHLLIIDGTIVAGAEHPAPTRR